MAIPGLYQSESEASKPQKLITRFITARISPDSVEHLLCHPDVLRMQLGMPRLPATDIRPAKSALQDGGEVVRTVIGVIDDGCAFAHPAFCSPDGSTRVHFLWDQNAARDQVAPWRSVDRAGYGAELRHPQLVRASKLALQGGNDELAYAEVNYGPLRLDLDHRSAMFDVPGERKLPVGTMLRAAHGTSAMYLAAGVADRRLDERPLRQQLATSGSETLGDGGVEGVHDCASRWPIVFVQLPTATTLDTSGGSLGVHVLDGIRYIVDRARCLPGDKSDDREFKEQLKDRDLGSANPAKHEELGRVSPGNKVVINISYGAVAGPHDGTSILEQAMADLLGGSAADDHFGQNTWICVAAGNASRLRTYARVSLFPGQSKSLSWRIPPDNPLQCFLELWLPECDAQGDPIDDSMRDRITLQVTPPGMPGQRVRCGQAWSYQLDPEAHECPRVLAGVVFARRVAQGLRGTMVLLAVAATRRALGDEAFAAPHGQWLIEVANENGTSEPGVNPGRELVIHAWTERNDLVFGTPRAQQAQVESEDPIPEPTEFTPDARRYLSTLGSFWPNAHLVDALEPKPSLGSLAGAASKGAASTEFFKLSPSAFGQTVAVGGYRLADGEVAEYSSGGPQRHVIERSFGQPSPMSDATRLQYAATGSLPRAEPDVQAPSDVGPSLRGLRTIGTRAGATARLSGTSAAAPSVARLIANAQHANDWLQYMPAEQVGGEAFGAIRPEAIVPASQRPVATPRRDDRFRRGCWRVR